MPADLNAYLARIDYQGALTPTAETLRGLHFAHVCAIPFENLTPWQGLPVPLDLPALEQKLVHDRRGGYCYEQNRLFASVLTQLGFAVTPLLARVRWQVPTEVVTGRSHLCLRVEIDGGPWLADVGFGGVGPTEPLRLDTEGPQSTSHDRRRLVPQSDGTVLHQLETEPDTWADLYRLETVAAPPIDVEVANWFTSTHPDSLFRNHLIVTRVQSDHRRALHDREFTRRYRDGRTERCEVGDLAGLQSLLADEFGLPHAWPFPGGLRLPTPAA